MRGFGKINKQKKINLSNFQNKDDNQILNDAIKYHYEGNLLKASKIYKHLIEKGSENSNVFTNYGLILINLGKLKDAEFFIRKAIQLNPKNTVAYSNLGGLLKDLRKLKDAEFFIRKAIALNPKDSIAHANLGNVFKDLGKLEEAEKSFLMAIKLNPKDSIAHANLGNVFKDLGKLEEAEASLLRAIEINPNFGKAYFFLSTFRVSKMDRYWEKYLFSSNILKGQNNINLIDIYFARANILENNLKYLESANMFTKANTLNRKTYDSNYISLKNEMQYYYKISQKIRSKNYTKKNDPTSIFIVGLPRSGKTITESILSRNNALLKCGEDNALSIAVDRYLNRGKNSKAENIYQLYIKNISRKISDQSFICSTKPGNFLFTGLIATQIPKSKVIYCIRNPLDHIKELYCHNIKNQFSFRTSIVECANILLSINELMDNYKNMFNSKIYILNYDKLVVNPKKEIKLLLKWLGWEYEKKYLYPQLDPSTSIRAEQINDVINTKYLNIWKHYKKLLQPAIQVLSRNDKYNDFIYDI